MGVKKEQNEQGVLKWSGFSFFLFLPFSALFLGSSPVLRKEVSDVLFNFWACSRLLGSRSFARKAKPDRWNIPSWTHPPNLCVPFSLLPLSPISPLQKLTLPSPAPCYKKFRLRPV